MRTGKKIRRTFRTRSEAKRWREEMRVAIRRGEIVPTTNQTTIGEAFDEWVAAAEAGKVRTRGRTAFAPSTIRSVRQNWMLRLVGTFGGVRLDRLTLLDVQDFVDDLESEGVNPGTIESTVLPLRLIYRRAKTRGRVLVDPTDGVELPRKRAGTRTPPSPRHALDLLDALDGKDRPLWATAMLTGLRRGELLALRWQDIDLDGGTVDVTRSWHPAHGYGPPKSSQGRRTVPVVGRLSPILREHRLLSGRRDGLVFTVNGSTPRDPSAVQRRADAAWAGVGLERVTLHACRHLYASMSIAAGVNAHALSKYMGHSSIAVTFDRYGHLFPGNEAEAAGLLDRFLDTAAASRPGTT